jgi:hypothetical protein
MGMMKQKWIERQNELQEADYNLYCYEREMSNCCGAERWLETTDICSKCKEHADFSGVEDEEQVVDNKM